MVFHKSIIVLCFEFNVIFTIHLVFHFRDVQFVVKRALLFSCAVPEAVADFQSETVSPRKADRNSPRKGKRNGERPERWQLHVVVRSC